MTGRIRTLVVDDQPMARERLLSLLALAADVDVIGTCASGAKTGTARLRPLREGDPRDAPQPTQEAG